MSKKLLITNKGMFFMKDLLNNKKLMFFLGGVAAGTLGLKTLKSKVARKLYVSTLANGMKIQQDAQHLVETMKEDAQDMCYEARETAEKVNACSDSEK